MAQNFRYRFANRWRFGSCNAVENHFRIGSSGKNRTLLLEFAPFFPGEGQVAVMANGYLPMLAGHQERLSLANRNLSGSGVTNMSNRVGAGQAIESRLIKSIRDVTHCAFL